MKQKTLSNRLLIPHTHTLFYKKKKNAIQTRHCRDHIPLKKTSGRIQTAIL